MSTISFPLEACFLLGPWEKLDLVCSCKYYIFYSVDIPPSLSKVWGSHRNLCGGGCGQGGQSHKGQLILLHTPLSAVSCVEGIVVYQGDCIHLGILDSEQQRGSTVLSGLEQSRKTWTTRRASCCADDSGRTWEENPVFPVEEGVGSWCQATT